MPKVRLTIGHDPVDVHESEIPVLRAQGLIAGIEAAPAAKLPPVGGGKDPENKENG